MAGLLAAKKGPCLTGGRDNARRGGRIGRGRGGSRERIQELGRAGQRRRLAGLPQLDLVTCQPRQIQGHRAQTQQHDQRHQQQHRHSPASCAQRRANPFRATEATGPDHISGAVLRLLPFSSARQSFVVTYSSSSGGAAGRLPQVGGNRGRRIASHLFGSLLDLVACQQLAVHKFVDVSVCRDDRWPSRRGASGRGGGLMPSNSARVSALATSAAGASGRCPCAGVGTSHSSPRPSMMPNISAFASGTASVNNSGFLATVLWSVRRRKLRHEDFDVPQQGERLFGNGQLALLRRAGVGAEHHVHVHPRLNAGLAGAGHLHPDRPKTGLQLLRDAGACPLQVELRGKEGLPSLTGFFKRRLMMPPGFIITCSGFNSLNRLLAAHPKRPSIVFSAHVWTYWLLVHSGPKNPAEREQQLTASSVRKIGEGESVPR